MPSILYPTQVVVTEGVKLDIGWLSLNSRTPQSYILTADAAAAINDEEIAVTSSIDNLLIQAGTKLTFGSQTVQVAIDAVVDSATATTLVLANPLTAAIAAADEAETKALLTVLGLTEGSPNAESQTVDKTNFLSGFGQEMVVTGLNRTVQCSGNTVIGCRATDRILKQVSMNDEKARREIYAELNMPSGERFEGAAIVQSYNTTVGLRDIQKYSFQLVFQGLSFKHTPATVYTAVAQDA